MTDRHAENYNAEVGNPDFAWETTLGPAYRYPLGVRTLENFGKSNTLLFIVKFT